MPPDPHAGGFGRMVFHKYITRRSCARKTTLPHVADHTNIRSVGLPHHLQRKLNVPGQRRRALQTSRATRCSVRIKDLGVV